MYDSPSTSKDYSNSFKLSKIISKRRKKGNTVSILSLPEEVLVEIVQKCTVVKEIQNLKLVNKRLKNLVTKNGHKFSRPEVDGITISVSKEKIPTCKLGRLRNSDNSGQFVEIFITKKGRSEPLTYRQIFDGEEKLVQFMASVLRQFSVKSSITFNGVQITDSVLSVFLKPPSTGEPVKNVHFTSSTFSKNLSSTVLLQFLKKTNCDSLNVEYCKNAENILTIQFIDSLKTFTLMPLPGQIFHQLDDTVLLNVFKKIQNVSLTNCVTSFTPLGVDKFLKNLKIQDANNNFEAPFNYDLGVLHSHPLDVCKFAGLHMLTLKSRQTLNPATCSFYFNNSSTSDLTASNPSNYGTSQKNSFTQKFCVDFELNFGSNPTLLESRLSPKCLEPFQFIANIASIKSVMSSKQVHLQSQSIY